jgi:hypothetical protein
VRKYRLAVRVLEGKHTWMERGIMNLPAGSEELKPPQVGGRKPARTPVEGPLATH